MVYWAMTLIILLLQIITLLLLRSCACPRSTIYSGTTGSANIYYEVYCKNCTSTFRTSMGIAGNESVDAVNWYQNNLHVNNTFGEFNSTAVTASSSGSLGARTLDPKSHSRLNTYVNRVNFGSSSWLRHYPEYFKVEFIGSGTWAGEGSVRDSINS